MFVGFPHPPTGYSFLVMPWIALFPGPPLGTVDISLFDQDFTFLGISTFLPMIKRSMLPSGMTRMTGANFIGPSLCVVRIPSVTSRYLCFLLSGPRSIPSPNLRMHPAGEGHSLVFWSHTLQTKAYTSRRPPPLGSSQKSPHLVILLVWSLQRLNAEA